MALEENLFQAQIENLTQLQNYYPFYQHKIIKQYILFIYPISFTGCYDQNAVFSIGSGPSQGTGIHHQNNSHNNTVFKNRICLDYPLTQNLQGRAIKTGKVKHVTGSDRKVILCNKWFGNYMKL